VTICHNGIGIAEEDQSRLFQRVSRAPIANKLAVQGSGLGLFFVKRIVEAHGGSVDLRPGWTDGAVS
jgi:two-component system phosphate regulon sensor histidine kinase PhoR